MAVVARSRRRWRSARRSQRLLCGLAILTAVLGGGWHSATDGGRHAVDGSASGRNAAVSRARAATLAARTVAAASSDRVASRDDRPRHDADGCRNPRPETARLETALTGYRRYREVSPTDQAILAAVGQRAPPRTV